MKKFKNLNILMLIVISVLNIVFIVKNIIDGTFDKLIDNGTLFVFLLVPFILKKIFKIKWNELFKFIYYIYIILMLFFGEVLELTKFTLWFDKIAHCYFGFLIAIVAVYIIQKNKNPKENLFFNILFIIGLTFIFSNCWEFIEYSLDQIFNSNHQRFHNTGMNDTMIDLLTAFLGGIILSTIYFIEVKKNKNGLVFNSIKNEN